MKTKRTEIVSVISQKGGVSKTTTSLALGAGLKRKGYKVLFVDLDAQGNLTYALNATAADGIATVDLLLGKCQSVDVKGDVICSTPDLATAEQFLTMTGKEYKLKEALEPLKHGYDYIIIDTPPSIGILTINALTASDSVIIPAQADMFSLQGIAQVRETIQAVKSYCNKGLKVKGILLARFNKRAIISNNFAEVISKHAAKLETKLFHTKIRECTAIKEAQARQQDIFSYAPRCNGAIDYNDFVGEFLKRKK